MQNTIRTVKWYHKGFALIAIFCSMLMFVAFSGSYSTTMKWVDMRLGKMEMRSSIGMDWLKVAIGSGLKVEAFNVQVMTDFPRMAENALISVVSGILSNILGTISDLFGQLIGKIQEMSSVFESIGGQSGDMLMALQTTLWPQIESQNSTCVLVDEIIGDGVNTEIRSIACDGVAKLRYAEVALKTADLTNPATNLPKTQDIQEAKKAVVNTVKAACDANSDLKKVPFSDILGQYSVGCGNDLEKKLAATVASDEIIIGEALSVIQDRAPADCKQPYADFGNTKFDDFSIATNTVISGFTGQAISSDFLNKVSSFGSSTEIKTLTPDDCKTLQSSTDAALAGTQVTPPSGAGATGLEAVIGKFIESVTKLINDLVDSVINIALDALDAVFSAFPRIFNEGFSQLFGNFSSIIGSQMSGISSILGSGISDKEYLDNLSRPVRTDGTLGDVNR